MIPEFRIAKPSELWRCGGIITEVEWGLDTSVLKMWDGTPETVGPGDKLLVFRRGMPFVEFVGVIRA